MCIRDRGVGDDKKMSETSKNNLEGTMRKLRSVKNDLAENIILVDFSRENDDSNLEAVKGALKEMNLPFEVMKRIYRGRRSKSAYQFKNKHYGDVDDLLKYFRGSLEQPASIPKTTIPNQTRAVQTDLSPKSDFIQSSSRGSARFQPYKRKTPRQPEPLFTQNDLEALDGRPLYHIEEPPRLRAPFTERDLSLIHISEPTRPY